MGNTTSVGLSSPQLFHLCATCPEESSYWDEFVRRFNPLLVRSMIVAWRRHQSGRTPAPSEAEDLLQEIYLTIVNRDFHLLKQFRGTTAAEAEAYLAHVTINRTITYLRARHALKHQAEVLSLDQLLEDNDNFTPTRPARPSPYTEAELTEILEQVFSGPNGTRDRLLFLLHIRDGYTAAELARLGLCDLKESSLYNLLGQMKTRLKNYFFQP